MCLFAAWKSKTSSSRGPSREAVLHRKTRAHAIQAKEVHKVCTEFSRCIDRQHHHHQHHHHQQQFVLSFVVPGPFFRHQAALVRLILIASSFMPFLGSGILLEKHRHHHASIPSVLDNCRNLRRGDVPVSNLSAFAVPRETRHVDLQSTSE